MSTLQQIRELRKLLRRYGELQKRLGIPDNTDETVKRLQGIQDMIKFVKNKREEFQKLLHELYGTD